MESIPGAVEVRAAAEPDLAALSVLEATVMPHGWSEATLSAELARSDARVWVACVDSVICGGAVARRVGSEVELLWIGVADGERRSGLGRRLLDAVVRWTGSVFLEVRASNDPARALYAEAGFVVVGRRPRYYRDGEDALVLATMPSPEATP